MEQDSPATLLGLIDQLVDPTEPAPVAMVPQTWGWAVVAVVLVSALALSAWRLWQRYRANAYRRAALHELAKVQDDPAAIAAILRRTALAAYPRVEVAGLAGESWLAFLDRHYPGTAFTSGAGRAVAVAPYTPMSTATGLHEAAADWIRRHRRETVQ